MDGVAKGKGEGDWEEAPLARQLRVPALMMMMAMMTLIASAATSKSTSIAAPGAHPSCPACPAPRAWLQALATAFAVRRSPPAQPASFVLLALSAFRSVLFALRSSASHLGNGGKNEMQRTFRNSDTLASGATVCPTKVY